ncbi:plastocyanin/azurin family copper-binding protein [Flexithrix dorotheae]|uniref:plastocyanin/azurin family copper-binding protein n=1 Tax=Flexithrix dorotheae TaxID=70993 RepID=UPI0003611792|nr:plastocyanin/azurin family copper-binding protein [Flexithrix dorotheae]
MRLLLNKGFIFFVIVGAFFSHPYAKSQDLTEIRIKAISGLKYDLPRFAVKPGTKVKIIFENSDEMAHNLVFTLPGKREEIVGLANNLGGSGPSMNFIPESEAILASIKVLNPDAKEEIVFTVPNEEGIYPYVCTYPGHGFIMFGAMYVTTKALPPLETDQNVPESQREKQEVGKASPHPYPLTYPIIYRTFLPDCGPAGIAVALNKKVSYSWDAGKCMFRYAWKDGFLDNSEQWQAKGKELSIIVGEVFYKPTLGFPFRLDNSENEPEVKFMGYRLENGFPKFNYKMGKALVNEFIQPFEDPNGIGYSVQFEVSDLDNTLIYIADKSNDKMEVSSDKGKWEGNKLYLTPEEGKNFKVYYKEIGTNHHAGH